MGRNTTERPAGQLQINYENIESNPGEIVDSTAFSASVTRRETNNAIVQGRPDSSK